MCKQILPRENQRHARSMCSERKAAGQTPYGCPQVDSQILTQPRKRTWGLKGSLLVNHIPFHNSLVFFFFMAGSLQCVSSKGHTPSSERCSWGSSGRGSAALCALRMHWSASRRVSRVCAGDWDLHQSLCTWAHTNDKIQVVRLQMKVHCLIMNFFKMKTLYSNS